jgi:hypothetical protein
MKGLFRRRSNNAITSSQSQSAPALSFSSSHPLLSDMSLVTCDDILTGTAPEFAKFRI